MSGISLDELAELTTQLEKAQEARKTNWDKLDVPIEHSGRAITLPGDPANMPLEKAVEALERKIADENQKFNLHEHIDNGHPFDAAVAFVKAMAKLYGWASPVPTPGFFGSRPPLMISVKTGIGRDDVVQCPIGRFQIPGVDQPINTAFTTNPKGVPCLLIYGEFKKKDRHILLQLANETRDMLTRESIYRGKAIRLGVDEHGNLDQSNPPEFMDVGDTTEANLVFDADIQSQIETNILVPIKHTAACKKLKFPLKRGVLLEGPYGTGKSLTARMVANVCEQNGWTFILLDRIQGLRAALEFANRYAPAVVFAEDIDRVASERTDETNDLINTIDGVVSKKSEIMTILTTNHADKLSPVIVRPGRLDAVISLRAPSNAAVSRLLKLYSGKLLPEGAQLPKASKELSGQIPASIRECVERAKLGMIGRGDNKLSDDDLAVAAQTMKNHLALLNRDTKKPSDAEVLADSLRKLIFEAASGRGQANGFDLSKFVTRIDQRTEEIHEHVVN